MPKQIAELMDSVLENPQPENLNRLGDIYGRAQEVATEVATVSQEPEVEYIYYI